MKDHCLARFVSLLLCLSMLLCGVHRPAAADGGTPCAHETTTVLEETVTEATCTEAGSRTEVTVCAACGEELSRRTVAIPALGHAYGETVWLREATCTEEGAMGRVCSRCGDQVTDETTPPAAHQYEDGVCVLCGHVENGATTWEALQEAISFGGEVTLTGDLTASEDDALLRVPPNISVVLHLNGKTINRNLSYPTKNGSVFLVEGSLTIAGEGVITGGNSTGTGGGIRVAAGGSLTLAGGTISGNSSKYMGGGICVSGEMSSFTMVSGAITGNTSVNGAGAALDNHGSIEITGGAITGNTASKNGGGIWFGGSETSLTVSGGTISGNHAEEKGGGIYINGEGEFTLGGEFVLNNSARNGSNIASKSGPYMPDYSIVIDGAIEGGSVTADASTAREGDTVVLTVAPDTAAGSYILSSLTVLIEDDEVATEQTGSGTYTFTMPAGPVTVTASFVQVHSVTTHVFSDDQFGSAGGCTLTSDREEAAAGETVLLTVHMEPGYRLLSQSGSVIEINYDYSLARQVDETTFAFVMPDEDVFACCYTETAQYWIRLSSDLSGVEFNIGDAYTWEPAPQLAAYDDQVSIRYLRIDESELQSMSCTYTEGGITRTVDIPFEFDPSDGFYSGSFRMPNADVSVCVAYQQLHSINEDWTSMQHGVVSSSVTRAIPGTEVRLWAAPDQLYETAGWHATLADGNTPVQVSPAEGDADAGSFIMPDGDVLFWADFVKSFYEIHTDPGLEHGALNFADGVFARPGETVAFTVVPDEYFTCCDLKVTSAGQPYDFELVDGSTFSFVMPEGDVEVSALFTPEDSWTALREAFVQGGTIVLQDNYAASDTDLPLVIPRSKTVRLDLNGCRIDGSGLNGIEVVTVNGTLIMDDSCGNGEISGENGESIIGVYGSLTLNDGGIVAYESPYGCVYVANLGHFTMNDGWLRSYDSQYGTVCADMFSDVTINGGTIYGEDGEQVILNAGVCAINGGSIEGSCDDIIFVDSGSLSIRGGTISGTPAQGRYGILINGGSMNLFHSPVIKNDVMLASGSRIHLDQTTVGNDIVIRLKTSGLGIVAQSWFGRLSETDLSHFVSADPNCAFRLTEDGKAEIYKVDGSLTSVFTWEELKDGLQNGGSLIIAQDIAAASGDSFLGVPSGVEATLDLNGFTIDSSHLDTKYVLVVDGALTIRDTKSGGSINSNYIEKGILKVQHGDVTMEGGTLTAFISKRVVYIQDGNFIMNGGLITQDGCDDLVAVANGGSFTMNGGSITGEGSRYASVYVFKGGQFTLNGGHVSGEYVYRVVYAGGIVGINGGEVSSGSAHCIQAADEKNGTYGTLTLRGGTLSTTGSGRQAVTAFGSAFFTISGNPVIRSADSASIRLTDGAVIRIADALNVDPALTVATDRTGVIARGANYTLTGADLARLVSADPAYGVRLNGNGEAELFARERHTVTFAPGGGEGEMEDAAAYVGVPFVLPDCGFTAPEGMAFFEWSVVIGNQAPISCAAGAEIELETDAAATALWEKAVHGVLTLPPFLQAVGEEAFLGDTSLYEVVIPSSVTRIEARAFAGSTLTRINLPAGIKYIAEDAFEGCRLRQVSAEGEYCLQWCADHGIIPTTW